jgi:hypothetical protein
VRGLAFFMFGLGWILGEWPISGGKWLICDGKPTINLKKWAKSEFKWTITFQKRSICGFFLQRVIVNTSPGCGVSPPMQ